MFISLSKPKVTKHLNLSIQDCNVYFKHKDQPTLGKTNVIKRNFNNLNKYFIFGPFRRLVFKCQDVKKAFFTHDLNDFLCRENIGADILQGVAVVTLTLLAFIGLVWLREQILHGGGPEWLEMEANANLQPGGVIGPNQQPQPQNNIMEDDAVNGLVLEGNLPADPAPPEILEDNAPAPGQVRPILRLFLDHLGPILICFGFFFFQICIKWFNLGSNYSNLTEILLT